MQLIVCVDSIESKPILFKCAVRYRLWFHPKSKSWVWGTSMGYVPETIQRFHGEKLNSFISKSGGTLKSIEIATIRFKISRKTLWWKPLIFFFYISWSPNNQRLHCQITKDYIVIIKLYLTCQVRMFSISQTEDQIGSFKIPLLRVMVGWNTEKNTHQAPRCRVYWVRISQGPLKYISWQNVANIYIKKSHTRWHLLEKLQLFIRGFCLKMNSLSNYHITLLFSKKTSFNRIWPGRLPFVCWVYFITNLPTPDS